MPTFQTLQDRVERRVIDTPAAVVTEVPDLINKAMRTLQEMHNFRVMETNTPEFVTLVGKRSLDTTVPTNFKEYRGRPYLIQDDGETRDLVLAPNRAAALDIFSDNNMAEVGEPKLVLEPAPQNAGVPDDTGARTWAVYPFPDGLSDYTDGEYRIVFPYWRFVAALSAGTDENWFTTNAEWYLVFMATAEAFYLDWDESRGQLWEARAGNFAPDGRTVGEFMKVLRLDKLARLGTVRELVFHTDVYAPQLRS